jgi:hypothetical protein
MKLKLSIAVGLIALVALFSYAFVLKGNAPDKHYLNAVKWIEDYEYGKIEDSLNYGHPVYMRAVEELGLVAADSISAEEAGQFKADLEVKMQRFHEELRAAEERMARNKQINKRRNEGLFQAQARDRLQPVESYPECEHGDGEKDDGHGHEGS